MKKKILILAGFISLLSCSDLEEKLNDSVSIDPNAPSEETPVDVQQLLNGAYGNLRDLQSQDNLMALVSHTTDEMAGPTRGRDWDDAGIWRVLHTHSWTSAHAYVNTVWRTLNRNSYNAQQVICNGATGATKAEAQFLRTFADFLILDLFGKIPRRECGENEVNPPSLLLTRAEAASVLISELEGVLSSLPDFTTEAKASKNSARALLCKLYLNKAVYAATTEAGAQAGPYTFAAADMNKVVEYANAIINSGNYSLDNNYFDNFIPENGEASSELIFVSENTSGGSAGNVRSLWFQTLHYNMNPSGWNGFVALADLYNRFEEGDTRREAELPYLAENNSGLNAGFLVGQQYDAEGNALKDRNENPLIFTPEFNLVESGPLLEVTGIRAIKYPPDFTTPGDAADNDYVFLRYADVLLMKAEAILRGGTSSDDPLDIVNDLRLIRGASALTSINLDVLLDERSRELYWEGWRRNDLIRFNKFLGTWQAKPNQSTPDKLLFPKDRKSVV